jgi:type II secretory pathway component PulF
VQFLSRRLSKDQLIELARSLKYSLASGIMLRDAIGTLSARGTGPIRPVADRLAHDLEAGWSFHDALGRQPDVFPPLFLALAEVGEETGSLPEVMGEVEQYYELQRRLHRDFVSGVMWPVAQFFCAVFIITGLIYILGELPGKEGEPPYDPLGLGLIGANGAATFLAIVLGTIFAVWAVFFLLRRVLRHRAVVDRMLLRLPVIGGCLRALALARFSVALQLVLDTGVSILKTFKLAFAATDNTAFVAAAPEADALIRRGNTITDALTATRLFPAEFLSAVAVGEDSGRLPEVLRQQAEYYDDVSKRRLAFLNRVLTAGVWVGVATVVIYSIFMIFKNAYLGNINKYVT